VRIHRTLGGLMLWVGPWAARASWSRTGRFGNGSRWWSGWSRWRDWPDY
jgi:hypothetical protein